jgi:hypothetical protein
MKGSEMIGYWSSNCPVTVSDPGVKATVYKKERSAMISIASWADTTAKVRLTIDWNTLGIDPAHALLTAPEIKNFQPARIFGVADTIEVPKGKGWLLIVKEQ